MTRPGTSTDPDSGPLRCPFCGAYQVDRLYLGSLHLDSCRCESCGARWDQEPVSGAYRGRAGRARA